MSNAVRQAPGNPAVADPAAKVPLHEKILYGAGSGSFQLSTDGVKGLANPIYNITLGLSPSLVGLVLMIARIFDAFTDPIMGKISDDARTRWGRRRPFIFAGSFLAAGAFILIWMVPESWAGHQGAIFAFYLAAMLLFYLCSTIQVVPYHTLGLEMTPDYNERTSVAGYKMAFSFIFTLLLPWIFRFAQSDAFKGHTLQGMRYWSFILAGLIIAGGILPALFVKERYYKIAKNQTRQSFLEGFKLVFQNRAFLMLTAIILATGLGGGMVNALGPYIVYYHIFNGDTKVGQELVAVGANCFSVVALLSIPVITRLSARYGKVRMLKGLLVLGIVGSLSSFVFYSKACPYLSIITYVLVAPQAAGFWVLTTSMKADICDDDELRHGLRREGMFGSIGNWIVKIAMSATFLLSGVILEATGFHAELKGAQHPEALLWMRVLFAAVPAVSSLAAFFLLFGYPLSARRMEEIRLELEARRSGV